MVKNNYAFAVLCLFLATIGVKAQEVDSAFIKALADRTQSAPQSVFKKFREAGMEPVNHILTANEREKVTNAFSFLPPLHQKILKEHLYSISFMDNMPNTALTSRVETSGAVKMFNITFRAEILKETVSQWATWKENTCFIKSESNDYEVVIDAGNLDAILYVLLHEATHVVDAVLNITTHPDEIDAFAASTTFTAGIWSEINKPMENATNTFLETTRYRSGKPVAISSAIKVYEALSKTPFASLYSMASWHEDLAEIQTIFHLTQKMSQPFKILIKKNGVVVYTFEPFTNNQVFKRQGMLALFYT